MNPIVCSNMEKPSYDFSSPTDHSAKTVLVYKRYKKKNFCSKVVYQDIFSLKTKSRTRITGRFGLEDTIEIVWVKNVLKI